MDYKTYRIDEHYFAQVDKDNQPVALFYFDEQNILYIDILKNTNTIVLPNIRKITDFPEPLIDYIVNCINLKNNKLTYICPENNIAFYQIPETSKIILNKKQQPFICEDISIIEKEPIELILIYDKLLYADAFLNFRYGIDELITATTRSAETTSIKFDANKNIINKTKGYPTLTNIFEPTQEKQIET